MDDRVSVQVHSVMLIRQAKKNSFQCRDMLGFRIILFNNGIGVTNKEFSSFSFQVTVVQ